MPSADTRQKLAAVQAGLAEALVRRGPLPAGFDAAQVQAAARSLARKRARAAARAWPMLGAALGQRFDELFQTYSQDHLLPRDGGPLADGRGFARWLAQIGELPEAGRVEAAAVDLRFVSRPAGLFPRRGWACTAAFLKESRRLLLGFRLPYLGERWLSIPLGRSRRGTKGRIILRAAEIEAFNPYHPG